MYQQLVERDNLDNHHVMYLVCHTVKDKNYWHNNKQRLCLQHLELQHLKSATFRKQLQLLRPLKDQMSQ
jgi:hypothetical protein